MRIVISRVNSAEVYADGTFSGKCGNGLLVLSCFTEGDDLKDIDYLVKKCTNLRIFDDENGVMNKSILDVGGSILSISQFTLYADATKGNRPSYFKALKGDEASKLYDEFNKRLSELVHTETGVFGSEMEINASHNGPITIIIDSKK